jgi:hypothetical protein
MVGPTKTIGDLARLDANPVMSCRHCTWRVEYDRGRLIAAHMAAQLNTDWQTFCATTRCEECGGPVRVAIKPFVSDTALREGDLKRQLVFKALCVLTEAQQMAEQGRVAKTSGLRLASRMSTSGGSPLGMTRTTWVRDMTEPLTGEVCNCEPAQTRSPARPGWS